MDDCDSTVINLAYAIDRGFQLIIVINLANAFDRGFQLIAVIN